MASAVSFGGLASGLDTNSIVAKLVEVERQPIIQLQQSRAAQEAQKTLVGDLTTKLTALGTAIDALKTQAAVQGRTADVPTGAPFGATVQGAAPTGSYSIQVTQLATAQRTYSNTFAAADTDHVFTGAGVTLTVGGQTATVNLTTTDTLTSAAQKINDSGLRLSAAVVYDGANYRIVVNGRDTGAANAITINDGGAGTGLGVAANTVVTAKNAQLTVDGVAISAATNTISSSIPGVTLNLKNTAVGATTLTVSEDPNQLKTSLKAIIDAYNAVMEPLNKQFATDGKSQLGPDTLAGDSTARQLQQAMLGLPMATGGPVGNAFTSLTEIGVNVDRYGVMSLDESALQRALAHDAGAVSNLLTGTDGTNGLMKKVSDSLKTFTDFVAGALPNKQKSIDSRIQIIDDDIARMETAASSYEQRLREQFSQMEQLIASFQSQTQYLNQITANQQSNNNQ